IQEFEPWSYKQIVLKKDLATQMQLPNDLSNAWTRKDAVFVAYPNGDGSLSGVLLLPKNPNKGFASLTTQKSIKKTFTSMFPEFLVGISEITKEILKNPEGRLGTIYTNPWYYEDFLVIL